jgi:RNase H-fold protein (predicted Holliday junction resolvase)
LKLMWVKKTIWKKDAISAMLILETYLDNIKH